MGLVQGMDWLVFYIRQRGQVQCGGERVPVHVVAGRLSALLPPRKPIHPLYGLRSAAVAPPQDGYQRPDHLVISGLAAF